MPNQRAIAKALGLSQAAVSLALRGSRRVSKEMREKVKEKAKQMGYRQNAYVRTLMSHIRAGKAMNEQGSLALFIDSPSEADWYRGSRAYQSYDQGILRRASELGFTVERFFLKAPGITPAKADSVIFARGVQGLIFLPPYRGNRSYAVHWERYACIGIGMGWGEQDLDVVDQDHLANYVLAFKKLTQSGYQRIGTALSGGHVREHRRGARWMPGYCDCQYSLPESRRIPLFVGDINASSLKEFRKWYDRWQPDAFISIDGSERHWFEEMKLKVPGNVAMACLAVPSGSSFSGIDERNGKAGAAAVDLVVAKIARNEYGIVQEPSVLMIGGRWVDGATTRRPSKTP